VFYISELLQYKSNLNYTTGDEGDSSRMKQGVLNHVLLLLE